MKKDKYRIGTIAAVPLGMILLVAGVGKLVLGQLVELTLFTNVIAAIEVCTGLLLLLGVMVRFAALVSALLIVGFGISNVAMIATGAVSCESCFGVLGEMAPAAALILDGIMAMLVVIIFSCYRGDFFNLKPWYFDKGAYV